METKKAYDLHALNTKCLNKLNFYRDDLKTLEKRIAEVVAKNTAKETLALCDHFSNKVVIQNEELDKLTHMVNEHEAYINSKIKANEVAADKQIAFDHPKLTERIERFEQLFAEFRKELIGFLAKVF